MIAGEERAFVRRMFLMLAGLIIWGAHFTVIYGFNALACARGFARLSVLGIGLVPATVVALTAVALAAAAAILYIVWRAGPDRLLPERPADGGFLRYMTVAVGLLSIVAIVWSGLPALLVPPCG